MNPSTNALATLALGLTIFSGASMSQAADLENVLEIEVDAGERSGVVTIQMLPEVAPGHVERIKELAREGFYDGVIFHRVIPGFMAQTGDPEGTGRGGSSKPDLKAEFSATPYERGTVGMARTNNPNSANSQFFITFQRTPHLDRQYTVWGQVTDGMELIDAIPVGEPPANPGKMVEVRVAADKE